MVVEGVRQMSVEEFLDFAKDSEEWYEYVDGELYPMTTATFRHNVISHNISSSLGILLAERNCQAVGMGQGIRVSETRFLIPDVCVVCGAPVLEAASRILLNPILVAEVTSPSSIDYDRVVKRDFYESVDSIQAYLIIDQHRILVELYTRSVTGWQLQTFRSLDDEVELEVLACRLPLREIYQSIRFDAGEAETTSDAN